MWKLFPDAIVHCPPDPDTYIICNNCEVECSDIVGLAVPPPPFTLIKLCAPFIELQTVCSEVRLVFAI